MVSLTTNLPTEGVASEPQINAWLDTLALQRSEKEIQRLHKAIQQAKTTHQGQQFIDGMDTLLALLHTADILDNLKLDTDTLLAAILSELPRQPHYDAQKLSKDFGASVAKMVGQAATIRELSANAVKKADDSEKLRRLLLNLAEDVRVILLLLAKRLRLLRRLKQVPEAIQKQIASETRRVHAPLANRLGVWHIKWELEDLSLRYLEPDIYKDLVQKLDSKRREREAFVKAVIQRLDDLCKAQDITAEISGRPKHIYSIWHKMQKKHLDFEQVFDVRAVRVLVDTTAQCYEVLGLVHAQWKPIPGEFDDYIANPKPNGYRSLHTAVVGEDGRPLEIQVRTQDMHEHAERGVAAHWRYKESSGQDSELERRIAWLRRWLEQPQQEAIQDIEEHSFTAKRIYVLSPQGKVVELPNGATPVDFAYAIHTDVGHRCRGAKVNGRITPLTTALASGQQVEIMTAKEGGPSRDWLNPHSGYVASSRASNRIRQWFKQQDHSQHVHMGRASIEREVKRLGVNKPDLEAAAKRLNHRQIDDLLAAVGRGDLSAIQVVNTQQAQPEPNAEQIDQSIQQKVQRKTPQKHLPAGNIVVSGVGDLMTQMARCCKPVPYDPIVGYITRGRGVTVHRKDCHMVKKMDSANQARLIDVLWGDTQQDARFTVDIQLVAADRKGLLRDVSSVFTNAEIDVLGMKSQSDRRQQRASMSIRVEVSDMNELSQVIDRLEQVPDVEDVYRQ